MSVSPSFRQRVLAREWLGGTFINLGSSITTEIAANCGFDWLMLDREHGPGSEETLLHQLQAMPARCASIVRITENAPALFKRVLDLGATGVMVPYVNTPDEARAAVASVRYPPHGLRGVSKFNRAAGFGQNFDAYYANAHLELVTMVQIETPESLEHLDAIASIDGVDVLFIGPLDLTTNMGIQGQFEHPHFQSALQKVSEACRRAGKAAGILATAPNQIAPLRELGFTVIAYGSDGGAVSTGLKQFASALRA